MEQQRLYAWSETSGLLDLDSKNHDKILNSNVFGLHRQTVLDMLVQIQCLFNEFTSHQQKHQNLKTTQDESDLVACPEKDAKLANFPMSDRKRGFIKAAMGSLKSKSKDGLLRLKWVSFDKAAFEELLSKFAILNDNMTNILDQSLQVEIRNTVQDTNRGVLLLHHKIADLSNLVLALKSQLDTTGGASGGISRASQLAREASVKELVQLSKLAKFKAFNETLEQPLGIPSAAEEAAARFLELANPIEPRNVQLPRYLVELNTDPADPDAQRCEAHLKTASGKIKVWIEWKDYDNSGHNPNTLSKQDIVDRVRKLASLLSHSPKPEAFRTPRCLGFFDKADPDVAADDVDVLDKRLGLIFERPSHDDLHTTLPPVSLHDLLRESDVRKPRVTQRIELARALSNCVLYLHAVNWLHKGLRSHNVLFFRTRTGHVHYGQMYLSGFDFSRPGGSDEMTDVPGDDAEHDLYRHPDAQANRRKDRMRSKKSFDVYSLGVVFVELAHWKTIDEVLKLDMRRARGKPDVLRETRARLLHDTRISDVGAEMGEQFERATKTCLAGGLELGIHPDDDETADDVAEKLSVRFYEDVVKRLQEIVV